MTQFKHILIKGAPDGWLQLELNSSWHARLLLAHSFWTYPPCQLSSLMFFCEQCMTWRRNAHLFKLKRGGGGVNACTCSHHRHEDIKRNTSKSTLEALCNQSQRWQPIETLDFTVQVAMVAVKLCHPNCDLIVDANEQCRHRSINCALCFGI